MSESKTPAAQPGAARSDAESSSQYSPLAPTQSFPGPDNESRHAKAGSTGCSSQTQNHAHRSAPLSFPATPRPAPRPRPQSLRRSPANQNAAPQDPSEFFLVPSAIPLTITHPAKNSDTKHRAFAIELSFSILALFAFSFWILSISNGIAAVAPNAWLCDWVAIIVSLRTATPFPIQSLGLRQKR